MTAVLHTAQRLARLLDSRRPGRRLLPALHQAALANAQDALHDVRRSIGERHALEARGERRVVPLSRRETLELLERGSLGRYAYIAREGVPDVVPVNYTWADGVVLIHSGPGPKLQAAQRGDVVAFEVDEIDQERRAGASAVVVGRAEVVDPLTPHPRVSVWAEGPRLHCIRIVPTRVAGRRLD
jgi:hypothetical protein